MRIVQIQICQAKLKRHQTTAIGISDRSSCESNK
uniref:Uncharacterized protein n=1 Tax=Arundo donax TaxID=35708 RepID=A0A0A8Y3G2_ARUDO